MELAPLIFGAGASYFVAALMMAYLYVHDGEEHMRWWAIAFALSVVRQLLGTLIVFTGMTTYVPILLYAVVIGAGLALMRGTYIFLKRPFSVLWYVAGAAMITASLVATIFEASFLVITIPVFFFRGVTDIITGAMILRNGRRRAGAWLAGVAFVLWGLHRWDYPFLRHSEWFAPWGFEIAAVLGVTVAIGMLALHYERTREELAQKERSYRDLFLHAVDGIIRTDMNGKILAGNPALVEMLGYEDEEEFKTLNMATDIYANPAERDRIAIEYADVDFLDGVEVSWKRKDGTVRRVQLTTRRYFADGAMRFEGSVRDVTEQRALQEQLEVARRMEALGRLSGGVAHDFNNVLTAIIGGIELARLEAESGKIELEELESIDLAARQGADLARRLLAFSRQDVESSSPMQVSAVISNAETMLSRLLPTTIRLSTEVETDELCILSEPGQLERLLVNLAVNAEQAMPDGGKLTVRAFARDDDAIIEVEDTGLGMDDATVERIFEPFFTTKSMSEGTGLGLATVFKIVESMNGHISVKSAVGEGSTFSMRFPISDGPADGAPLPTEDDDDITLGATVLLAEDDVHVRNNLVRFLRKRGYEVIHAEDGDSAVELAMGRLNDLQIVVLDVVMPGKTGPVVARELRVVRPEIPILFMSGYAAEELLTQGISEQEFLAKPFSPKNLVEKIEAVLATTGKHIV